MCLCLLLFYSLFLWLLALLSHNYGLVCNLWFRARDCSIFRQCCHAHCLCDNVISWSKLGHSYLLCLSALFACLLCSCTDPEEGGGRASGPPLKNHKNLGFLSNTCLDPLKITKLPASIQCWAIIRVFLAGWPVDSLFLSPLITPPAPPPPPKKKKSIVRVGPPLAKLSGSAHVVIIEFSI